MSLEDITKYESAAVAATNLKERPHVAMTAINNFYNTMNLGEDPIIMKALIEGVQGVNQGHGITNIGVIQAAQIYGQDYQKAFNNTSVSDLLNYLGQGYQIPQTVTQALGQYSRTHFGNLEDENAKMAIGLLQKRKLDNIGLGMEVTANNEMTTHALMELYPEQEN